MRSISRSRRRQATRLAVGRPWFLPGRGPARRIAGAAPHRGAASRLRVLALPLALAFAATALGLPDDSEQPIEIRADQARSEPDGTTVFTGAVQIEQGTLSLAGERVTVATRDKRLHNIVAEGDSDTPVRFRQQLQANEPFANGRANHIDYAVTEQRLALKGDAFLSLGDREFAGDVITWDIKGGRVDAQSDDPRGVIVKWPPEPKPAD